MDSISPLTLQPSDDMYYVFCWHDPITDYSFSLPLDRKKCSACSCQTYCSLGIELCTKHLRSRHNLEIRPSLCPNGGLGLFTLIDLPADFEFPLAYRGELLAYLSMVARYVEAEWGPYCVRYGDDDEFLDAAAHRSILAMMNTASPENCNVKFTTGIYTLYTVGAITTKRIPAGTELLSQYTDPADLHDPSQEHMQHFSQYNYYTRKVSE